jgi:hypothetical protein
VSFTTGAPPRVMVARAAGRRTSAVCPRWNASRRVRRRRGGTGSSNTELAQMRQQSVQLTAEERGAFHARHDQVNLD